MSDKHPLDKQASTDLKRVAFEKKRAAIRKMLREMEEELIKEYDPDAETIDDIEDQSHRIGERMKRIVSERSIRDKEIQDRQDFSALSCPDCGKSARYVGIRTRQLVLRYGTQSLSRRYFQCLQCHSCFGSFDQDLKIGSGQFSRCVLAMVVRLNTLLTDRQVSQEMEELLGISISVSTIQRCSQEVGHRLKQEWDTQVVAMRNQRLSPSEAFPSRLHTGSDGVMIHLGGSFQEVKTASVFETDKNGQAMRIRYVASHTSSQQFGPYWRILGHQAGMDHCADVAVVADGAAWIWMEAGKYFPGSKQILDFCHAMGYVWAVSNLRFGLGSFEAGQWAQAQSQLLHADAVAQVRDNTLEWKPRKPENQKARKALVSYIDQHAARMKYGTFQKENYQIGSGVIEACNKNVIQARMKRAGMRWSDERGEPMLQLCAWYHSYNRPEITRYLV